MLFFTIVTQLEKAIAHRFYFLSNYNASMERLKCGRKFFSRITNTHLQHKCRDKRILNQKIRCYNNNNKQTNICLFGRSLLAHFSRSVSLSFQTKRKCSHNFFYSVKFIATFYIQRKRINNMHNILSYIPHHYELPFIGIIVSLLFDREWKIERERTYTS